MLVALRGSGDRIALISEFRLLTPENADEWTMSVPVDMVKALAALSDSEVRADSLRSANVTKEELGWSQADFEPVVNSLRTLARRAEASGKKMFLWNSL